MNKKPKTKHMPLIGHFKKMLTNEMAAISQQYSKTTDHESIFCL